MPHLETASETLVETIAIRVPLAERPSAGVTHDRRGGKEGKGQFFYSFDLDKVIPPDHLVRQIELLNLSWVHIELAPYHSHMGRLSIDPVLMDPDFPRRLILVCAAPNRRICAEIQVNLAYRWFCKLGIEDKIPDHSVFCRARHERFQESDALRQFEGVVANVHCRRAFVAAKPRNDVAPVFKYDRSRKEISIDFAFG